MLNKLLLLAILFLAVSGCGDALAEQLRDGDIIFQTSRSAQSAAIQKATHSKYSHVGIILFCNGAPCVFEAIQTVQYTPLKQWVARGDGGHYVVKRLRDADCILTPANLAKLREAADRFRGRPYDPTFEWSDSRIYCSELVWKIYERGVGVRVGRLQTLRDFDLSDPIVKAKMKERYGSHVPLAETVISPGAIFSFEGFTQVVEH